MGRGDPSSSRPGARYSANLLGERGRGWSVGEEGQLPRVIGGESAWAATDMAMQFAPGVGTPVARQSLSATACW